MPLLFKKCYFEAIRQGRKTQTVRLWRRAMVRPGRSTAVPFLAGGRLHVESVEPLAGLAELTDSDAAADGFESRAAMLAALGEIYPELAAGELAAGEPAGRRLFRVRFRFVPKEKGVRSHFSKG